MARKCTKCMAEERKELEAQLDEVKELSATHDSFIAEIEKSREEGKASDSDVQKAYRIGDEYAAEIELLQDKIAAAKRIEERIANSRVKNDLGHYNVGATMKVAGGQVAKVLMGPYYVRETADAKALEASDYPGRGPVIIATDTDEKGGLLYYVCEEI